MTDPYLIISSDCHAGLPTEEYRPYLDARFHREFDDFLAGRDRRREEMTRLGVRNEAFADKWFHDNEEGLRGGWDAAQRLKELDGDGVAAEVVFPDADAVDSRTAAPFGVGLGLSGDQDPELGMAARRPTTGGSPTSSRRTPNGTAESPCCPSRVRSTVSSPRSTGPRSPVSGR